MNKNMLLAALAASVVAFLLGWLLFGIALAGYYESSMVHYEGLMKSEDEMNIGLIYLGNLLFAILITWCCSRMGVGTLAAGFTTGAIISALFYANVDIMFLAMMNMFQDPTAVIVDILVNALWGGAVGAAAGFMLGRGAKAAA
ncbi:MAG: hypothetical protein JNM31_04165 [Flavobacteriales bacterium]|nr:hypothetical protein [Flavobacteriales bacterium]